MTEYGIDVDDELAADTPRYGWLLDRILDLPDPYSRFREAMSEDEEMAELLIELEEAATNDDDGDEQSSSLRYSQVGLQEHLLMSIDMGIKVLRAEAPFAAGNGKGKPQLPKPWPKPRTAVERVKARRDREAAELVALRLGFDPSDL